MEDIAIRIDGVNKTFRLPHEKQSSVKGMFVNIFKGRGSFEKQQALKNINFDIKKGDFFGIVGRNGSGKSTLLKLLAGIYSPDTGRIHVNGKLTPFIELGVGFNPELTGRENVFLNSALLGFNRREVKAMYDDIVQFSELKRFMDQKLKNYSSGMQVRLAFSIAVRARSDILLLDEVLAVGDAAFQQKCFTYFEELKRQGKTVVFVSHDMSAIKRFCTRAVYIKDGKLIHEADPLEIADIYLDENINKNPTNVKGINGSITHKLSAKIVEQTADRLHLNFSYKSEDKENMYVGISLIKDGVSIAEINSLPNATLKGSGKLSYSLDISFLNGGVYSVSCALFKKKNMELVSLGENRCEFLIKHNDDLTKGGAVKLANNWQND